MAKRTFKAFTLIELLVVVTIISVLISILLPSLQRARQMGQATACMANLRTQGIAFQLYAQEYNDYIPSSSNGSGGDGWLGRLMPYMSLKDIAVNATYPNIIATTDAYKKLKGTAFDCPSTLGPMYNPNSSVDNYYRYDYAINVTPAYILTNGSWSNMYTRVFRNSEIPYPTGVVLVGESNAAWTPIELKPYDSYMYRFYCWCNMAGFIEWKRHGPNCNWLFFDGHVESMSEKKFWANDYYFGRGGWRI